jgi:transcriptional regulator with XRE-family HTH domain
LSARTNQAFRDAVADLLDEREWSQRDLSAVVGVDPAHVSRLLKRGSRLRATPQLIARVARALEVEPEFFVEYREWCVLEAVRGNPSLRERLYGMLQTAATP